MIYVSINGYAVPYEEVPCSKCPHRYAISCPICLWNSTGKYNTYQEVDPAKTKGIKTFKEAIKDAKN